MDGSDIWITKGYEMFALFGKEGLKIEKLAKSGNISKSSFYHHFADLEVFEEKLLQRHLKQTKMLAEKERTVAKIDPELIEVLLDYKIDLLFNRQLRFHRERASYRRVVEESDRQVGTGFVDVWKRSERLSLTEQQVTSLYELALENFYLQITPENISYGWLSSYFKQLNLLARRLH